MFSRDTFLVCGCGTVTFEEDVFACIVDQLMFFRPQGCERASAVYVHNQLGFVKIECGYAKTQQTHKQTFYSTQTKKKYQGQEAPIRRQSHSHFFRLCNGAGDIHPFATSRGAISQLGEVHVRGSKEKKEVKKA